MKKKYLYIALFFLWACEAPPPTNWDGVWVGITTQNSNDILEISTPDGANYKIAQYMEEGARTEEIVTCAMSAISFTEAHITCEQDGSFHLKIEGELIKVKLIEEEWNEAAIPCIDIMLSPRALGYDSEELAFQAIAVALGYESFRDAYSPTYFGNCNEELIMMMRSDAS
tara:strand:- start:1532 stop:2041 length:510 start_codon:yes stop_codon:yes gene_type:complete